MEETLIKLVGMPTISEDIEANNQALDYIQDYVSQRGMHCKRFVYDGHGLLLATTQPDSLEPRITLYGHIDVISGTEQIFLPRRDGDKLYGRGTYDMKFAIATYLHVIDNLQGSLQDYDFAMLIVSDEELGGKGGVVGLRSFLDDQPFNTEICLMPDGARNWDVEAAAKGWWRFELIAQGQTAHSSRPWEGDSASFKLIQALHELRERFADHSADTDTLNIGKIYGEGEYNQVPAHMAAHVEIRLASNESIAINQAFVETLCAKYDLEVRTDIVVDVTRQDTSHPFIHTYKDIVAEVTGYRPKDTLSLGGSDASFFNAKGTSCIITYLPGGGHHSEREWISVPDFLQFLPVVQKFLERTARISVDVDA